MSTIDEQGNLHRGSGAGGGQFMHKTQTPPETTLVPPGALSDLMDFDHVVTVGPGGAVTYDRDAYAPLVTSNDDDPLPEDRDWKLLRGFTGQHGYNGHIMHPSELLDGPIAEHILANPGQYVVVEVQDEVEGFPEGDPIGWAVAYREDPNTTLSKLTADLDPAVPAGYTYRAENLTGSQLIEQLIVEGRLSPGARGMTAEDALFQLSEAEGVDRDDLYSFDSDDFPKPVMVEQLTTDDIEWLQLA